MESEPVVQPHVYLIGRCGLVEGACDWCALVDDDWIFCCVVDVVLVDVQRLVGGVVWFWVVVDTVEEWWCIWFGV